MATHRLIRRRASVIFALFVGVFALLLGVSGAGAEVLPSAAATSAVMEATTGTGLDTAAAPTGQSGEYDWTLTVAFVFGIIGLIFIRRHIAKL